MNQHNFHSQGWAITPDGYMRIASFDLEKLAELSGDENEARQPDDSYKARLERAEEDKGVAILRMRGPLMQEPPTWARRYFEMCCSVEIEGLIREAAKDPSVQQLILDIDSPGGTVTGTPEVGDALAEFSEKKPSYAFTKGMMASAAYWIGSQAREVVSTKSALVGSIGVIRPHVDLTKARDKEGVKIELFTAGKHKAAGAFNTALTDEQRERIQAEVDAIMLQFREAVNTRRNVSDSAMDGQIYYGRDALSLGIVDKIVPNFSALLEKAQKSNSRYFYSANVDKGGGESSGISATTDMENENTIKELEAQVEAQKAEAKKAQADVADLQAKVDAHEATLTEKDSEIATLKQERDDASEAKAALETEVEQLKADAIEAEKSKAAEIESKAAELAEQKAAEIASKSGTDPLEVTSSADEAAKAKAEIAKMNKAELWAECNRIRNEEGMEKSRAFYKEHLKGK